MLAGAASSEGLIGAVGSTSKMAHSYDIGRKSQSLAK